MEPEDTITIAPSVLLLTIIQAATRVEGVARMGSVPDVVGRLFRGNPMANGVVVDIDEKKTVTADVYLIAKGESNVVEVSREVQQRVSRAIIEMVGMNVRAVNVHIEDVDYTAR